MRWPSFLNRRFLRSTLRGAWRYMMGKHGRRWVGSLRLSYRLRVMMLLFSPRVAKRLGSSPHVRLWVDREAFSRVKKLIGLARHTIIIQMFLWKDDRVGRDLASWLLEAADRGVKVYITKEAVGDFFEQGKDFLGTRDQFGDFLWHRFWHHPNIRITHATHQDHAKVYVIDDHILLLTGMNVAEEYDGPWHDYLVEIGSAALVHRYLTREDAVVSRGLVRLVMNTERRKEIRPTVMELIASAKHAVVLEQSYLSDPSVLRALVERSREGISITVILPSETDVYYYTNMQTATHLLRQGSPQHMRLFLYSGMIHGKIMLVDRYRAFLGSANMISSSLDDMGEVNVLIEGRFSIAVRQLRDMLRDDLLRSRPLRSPPVLAWFQRLLAWMRL